LTLRAKGQRPRHAVKAAFRDTDIDTDTDIARILARMSVSMSLSWNAAFIKCPVVLGG